MPTVKTKDITTRAVRTADRAGELAVRMKNNLIRGREDQSDEREYENDALEDTGSAGASLIGRTRPFQKRENERNDDNIFRINESRSETRRSAEENMRSVGSARIRNRHAGTGNRTAVRNPERNRTPGSAFIRNRLRSTGVISQQKTETVIPVRESISESSRRILRKFREAFSDLINALSAGGVAAVIMITVICFVGLIAVSPYGIFLSQKNQIENIADVVRELSSEYYGKIESIKQQNPYDGLEMSSADGSYSIRWNDILSVYSVVISTNSSEGAETVTMDSVKKDILRGLFEEMNPIDYSVESETYEETVTVTDEDGNEREETAEKTRTTLRIITSHLSAAEAAKIHSFSEEQNSFLEDMLSGEYSTLWASVIGGYSGSMGLIPSEATWRGTGRFSWPLPVNGTITSGFGYRSDPFIGEERFHGGLDIAAAEGTPVLAADDGVVTVANGTDSWGGGYGFHVMIDHGSGYETLYGHCSSICVFYGQSVRKGEVIAYVGSTGNSTGDHLHFEIRENGQKTDPILWFC